MKKVYVVTSGEWDDYGIVAIFSTLELAEKYLEKYPKNEYDPTSIEEWDIDKFDNTTESA